MQPEAVVRPSGVHFVQISAGGSHTCAIGDDQNTYCWGADSYGQLGDGLSSGQASHPIAVTLPAGVHFIQVSSGYSGTCALGDDGNMYCWGSLNYGGGTEYMPSINNVPTLMPTTGGVVFTQVAMGYYHLCGLGSDGIAYCLGRGTDGQLGDDTGFDQTSLTAVAMPSGVTFTSISSGSNQTCAIGSDTKTYCWGYGGYVGDGTSTQRNHPVAVTLSAGVKATELAAGGDHSCARGNDQIVYCWGDPTWGQDGTGSLSPGYVGFEDDAYWTGVVPKVTLIDPGPLYVSYGTQQTINVSYTLDGSASPDQVSVTNINGSVAFGGSWSCGGGICSVVIDATSVGPGTVTFDMTFGRSNGYVQGNTLNLSITYGP